MAAFEGSATIWSEPWWWDRYINKILSSFPCTNWKGDNLWYADGRCNSPNLNFLNLSKFENFKICPNFLDFKYFCYSLRISKKPCSTTQKYSLNSIHQFEFIKIYMLNGGPKLLKIWISISKSSLKHPIEKFKPLSPSLRKICSHGPASSHPYQPSLVPAQPPPPPSPWKP